MQLSALMERYFFDIQSGRELFADEEGLCLSSQRAAEVEGLRTLLGIARDSFFLDDPPDLAVEVRSATNRLFCVSIIYRNASTQH
jgi:hypothetical protein